MPTGSYTDKEKRREQSVAQTKEQSEQSAKQEKKNTFNNLVNSVKDNTAFLKKKTSDILELKDTTIPKEQYELDCFRKESAHILDIPESEKTRYKLLRIGYNILPIIDALLLWIPLREIVAKAISFSTRTMLIKVLIEISVFIVSVLLGYLLNMLVRVSLASQKNRYDKRVANAPGKKAKKTHWALLTILPIPIAYLVAQIYVGGSWIATSFLIIVSLTLQIVLYFTYTDQLEADEYYKTKKEAERLEQVVELKEKELEKELGIFHDKVNELMMNFLNLNRIRLEQNLNPADNLSYRELYIANLVTFGRFAIAPTNMENVTFKSVYGTMIDEDQQFVARFRKVYLLLSNGDTAPNLAEEYEKEQLEWAARRQLYAGVLDPSSSNSNEKEPVDVDYEDVS